VVGPPSDDEPWGSEGRNVANRNASGQVRATSRQTEPSGATIALNMSAAGFGVLAFVGAVLLAKTPPWTFSAIDALFWGAVVGLVGVRYAEVRRSSGEPGQSDRAEALRGWKQFAIVVGVLAVLVWLAAQAVQGGR
jgi:hypothetical protein